MSESSATQLVALEARKSDNRHRSSCFVSRDLTGIHNSSSKFAQEPAVGFTCIWTFQDQTTLGKIMELNRFRRLWKVSSDRFTASHRRYLLFSGSMLRLSLSILYWVHSQPLLNCWGSLDIEGRNIHYTSTFWSRPRATELHYKRQQLTPTQLYFRVSRRTLH